MAERSDSVTNSETLQHHLVQYTLASWRYCALSAVPPLLWATFVAPQGVMRAILVLLCGIVFYGCWRMWLDRRYLSQITRDNNLQAGEALFSIWRRERVRKLSLAERQRGALKHLNRTLPIVGATWVIWMLALML